MSTEFIAEKRANHIAVADKPDMCKVGNTVCAFISFSTFDQATDLRGNPNPTNGQDTPVFHMGSYVPKSQGNAGIGIRSGAQSGPFNPQEHSSTVKSQGEFQVHDGHVGQINAATPGSLAGNTTAVVNAGATGGGEVDVCLTKLKLQLANLKEKIAAEWQNSPTSFMMSTASGMGSGAVDAGSGMVEGVWGALQGAWGVVSNPWESAKGAYNSLTGGAKEAYDLGQALYGGELTIDDIVEGITEALMDALGATACSVADQLQEMLSKPNGGAEGLGYLLGQVAANVAVTVGTAGAGAAGQAALKGTQVARLAGEASAFAMRKGESMAAFFKRLKLRRKNRRHRDEPEGGANVDDGNSNKGRPNNPGCRIMCLGIGNPVNPVYGCKYLAGQDDLDFALPGLPPIVWQRSYFSDIAHVGAFGQGWTLPYDMAIVRDAEGHTLIDAQGRLVPLPAPTPGRLGRVSGEEMLFGALPDYSCLMLLDSSDQLRRFTRTGPQRWRLTSMSDRYGNTLLMHWNEAGQLAAISSDAQRRVELEYVETPAGARASAVYEVMGRKDRRLLAAYRYTQQGDLSQVCDRQGNVVREFEWRNHIMVMHRRPGGLESRYEYDVFSARGKVVRNWDSLGRQWRLIYRDGETRVVDHLRRSTRFGYDWAKRLTLHVNAEGGETRFDLDGDGNVLLQTDPAGRTRRYARNSDGMPILVTDPDGAQTYTEYHGAFPWLPVSITDAEGHTNRFEYDERGGLSATIDPLGARLEYRRDTRGLITQVRDAHGGVSKLSYDEQGNKVADVDCTGSQTRYRYDESGNLAAMTDALGATTEYRYDLCDRLVEVHHPDGAVEHLAYDTLGRLIAYSDPTKAITRYHLAPDGQPVARTDALGHTLHYRYDAARRMSELINENGASHKFDYDVSDRLVQEIDFDQVVTRYRYDGAGNLIEREEPGRASQPDPADIIRTRYRRDAAGRILELTASHARTRTHVRTQYEYSAIGRLISARNNAGTIGLRYDAAGHLVEEWSEVAGVKLTLAHAYDALGNRLCTTLPDGRNLNWLYYGSGHLHQINIDGDVISDMERDALHREVSRTQGRLQSHYHYDLRGRLLSQQAGLVLEGTTSTGGQARRGGVHFASDARKGLMEKREALPSIARRYAYDLAGNLLSVQDAGFGATAYRYDAIGRLVQAGEERFAFDPASNMSIAAQADGNAASQASGLTPVWPFGADGTRHPFDVPPAVPQVSAADSIDNRVRFHDGHRYSYDAHGNVIEMRSSDQVMRFSYDPMHRMIEAEVVRQGVTQRYRYLYDAMNRRVGKRDLFGMTRFVWDADRLLAETRARRTRLYIYGNAAFVPVAHVESRMKGSTLMAEVFHHHVDQIGTPREITGQDGNLAWRARYRAWGNAMVEIEDDPSRDPADMRRGRIASQPLRFQGQYYDEETGLHYNRHRYYDPHSGRYTSKDPIGLTGGFNLYRYCLNPTGWVDPLGLMPWRWNENGMGHHMVWRKKASSCGLKHLATERDTPTYFPIPYKEGDHEALHRAQSPHIGGRQGEWSGTADELLSASGKGLEGLTMKGELRIPSTGEVLAKDVTPSEAYKKLLEWHEAKVKKSGCP